MCKVKGAALLVVAALAGGVVSRALPSWPGEARAQDFNDGNPFTVEITVANGMAAPISNKIPHVVSTKVDSMGGVNFVVLKTADRTKYFLNPAAVLSIEFKPEG